MERFAQPEIISYNREDLVVDTAFTGTRDSEQKGDLD